MKTLALASAMWLGLTGMGQAADGDEPYGKCDNKPVIMVVSGTINDREAIGKYAQAIADAGLYPALRGYYTNAPRPIAVFEGDVPNNYSTLVVRFPCLAHAKAFWYSDVYQNDIIPLRTETNAGTFTVTVYNQTHLPDYMKDKLDDGEYVETFDVTPSADIKPAK